MYVCVRAVFPCDLFPARKSPRRAFVSAHTFCNLPPCTLCESKLMPPACVLHPVPAGTSILIADKIHDYPRNMFHDCKRECINTHYYVFFIIIVKGINSFMYVIISRIKISYFRKLALK